MQNKSTLTIEVSLDENKVPDKIIWNTGENGQMQEIKAIIISLFDKETKDTLKLDLWTKEMEVIEMDRFIFHSLNTMADTYFKATNNQSLANDMRNFANYFAEKVEIIAPSK